MKIQKNWLPFLAINMIISAATILIVLAIWSQVRPGGTTQVTKTVEENLDSPPPTLPALDASVISIVNVFGSGDLNSEVVRIRHQGENPLLLQDWTMQDSEGNTYSFPKLTLYSGVVEVYTRSGTDTVISLFWGRNEPVWQQGDVVSIYDPEGNLRSSFQIP